MRREDLTNPHMSPVLRLPLVERRNANRNGAGQRDGRQRADVGVDHSHLGFTPASRRRRRCGALHWKRHSLKCA